MIRHATEQDIPYLLPLLEELGYPTSLEALTTKFQSFMQNNGYGVSVCELEGHIAGFVSWSRTKLFVSNITRFHIEGLVVANSHRRRSVGKKLMEFVENIAKENSPAIVDLTSGLRRKKDGSHDFYKSIGYTNKGQMAKLYLRKYI